MTINGLELEEISSMLRTEVLGASHFDSALVLASLYGRLHWDNISGFFSDEELEQALFERWKSEFKAFKGQDRGDGSWCHLVTRAYASGGHTRLLRQLANGLDDVGIPQSLIVSQKVAKKTSKTLSKPLRNVRVMSGNLAQRARGCFAAGQAADVVLMHIHPDDIVAALAARALRQSGKKVLFVNHADHVFSFGPGAADAVLEICATGWKTTQQRRHALAQHFMGIPITSEREKMPPEREVREGPILTIGGPGKYQPSSELNFSRFLQDLLNKVPNDAVLIGPTGNEAWWADLRDKFPKRVHFKGVLPPDEVKREYLKASCYVDSFPMDGGTTFSEAMMQGVAAFGLNRQSALGISPADGVRCNSEKDLYIEVSDFLSGGEFPKKVRLARQEIATELSTEGTVRRVQASSQGQGADLPASLSSLGNRSIDYNAESWKAAGRLQLPKRLWRKLPISTRIRLMHQVRQTSLSKETLRALRKCILFG
jgi:hypothetical protein